VKKDPQNLALPVATYGLVMIWDEFPNPFSACLPALQFKCGGKLEVLKPQSTLSVVSQFNFLLLFISILPLLI
jgi:hypothetical protein